MIISINYLICEVYWSHPWPHGYPPSGLRIPGPVYQSPISSDEVQGVFHNNCGFPPRTFISQYPCLASTWLLESANGTDCTFEFCCSDQAAKNELQFFLETHNSSGTLCKGPVDGLYKMGCIFLRKIEKLKNSKNNPT